MKRTLKRTIGVTLAAVLSVAVLTASASALVHVTSSNTLSTVPSFSKTSVSVTGTYSPGTAGDNANAKCVGASRPVTVAALRTDTNTSTGGATGGTTATVSPFTYSFSSSWSASLPANKTYNVTTTVTGLMSGSYGVTYVCDDAKSNAITKTT